MDMVGLSTCQLISIRFTHTDGEPRASATFFGPIDRFPYRNFDGGI